MSNAQIKWSYIIIGAIVLIALWLVAGFNGLVSARENVRTQWSQVETQYQRRMDLLPSLVNTVKGAANFEQETLQNVIDARTKWMSATTSAKELAGQADEAVPRAEQVVAAQQFDSALARLLVTVEAYPQLKATEAFRDFMAQLEGTENRISTARRDYNEAVQAYNVRVKRFPGSIVAGMFSYGEEKFFEAQSGAENVPPVNFE